MNLSRPFIARPIGTALLALALAAGGVVACAVLPAAPLPEVEYPTISVRGSLPGADPETMANAVATPLERRLGRIAGVTEMTSASATGYTRIVLQFDLDRNIDGAARDVQAAIDASKGDLPKDMPQNPTYYKSNPADAPIMLLALTSPTRPRTDLFDAASTVLQQRLLRTAGVGEVGVGGGALPAVRIDLDPQRLNQQGIALEDVRRFLLGSSLSRALGGIDIQDKRYTLRGNDNPLRAENYAALRFRTRDGSVIRISDMGTARESVEDLRNFGVANGHAAVLLVVYKQPGANIIDAVAAIRNDLPLLRAAIPPDIDISVIGDRTPAIRASLADIEFTLLTSIVLVILVVLAFLRSWRTALIPAVAVPLSLLGTAAVMTMLGFSLNILSLMALAISTGFVVDDAIVVVENIGRHLEQGRTPLQAALNGTREIGFTVVSITVSLIAALIPMLFMGGIVGRLFREFAVSLAVAIGLSMVISLTLTPMMCRTLMRPLDRSIRAATHRPPSRAMRFYAITLDWALDHHIFLAMVAVLITVASGLLYGFTPKGFFPAEDTGRITGSLYVSQDRSFLDVRDKFQQVEDLLKQDPGVANVVGYVGTGLAPNEGTVYMYLKPAATRAASADEIMRRIQASVAHVPDVHLYLKQSQDVVIGGRQSAGQYQYTLTADNAQDILRWAPTVQGIIRRIPGVIQVTSNRATGGRQSFLEVNRTAAARYGISVDTIDQTLYDAFGQRRLSVLYHPANLYRVVMEIDPDTWNDPAALGQLWVPGKDHSLVPLSMLTQVSTRRAPLIENHTGQFPSETISFNLEPGVPLGDVTDAIQQAVARSRLPTSVTGSFSGTAQAFEQSLKQEPLLIAVALAVVYLTLGILYEDLIHPLTVLSSLPPAGLGALLTLAACGMELNVMALIGLILLIGIVKKNAIMLIDFALALQRETACGARAAIRQACLTRARPIIMTTMAALLGALPLVFGSDYGAEFRRPLGLTIIGGLVLSQFVTLYTTPAIYLLLSHHSRSPER
ncbi:MULTISPECIES: efflux RND transporter permease subunit [unclassified Achromobacter]|uniref:efflux RND transporter permease subunit n=1 Tax=unclassified Achromobacter TaxID=2626865 RepID=UPI000B51E55D|nr:MULTISPECIES: efflux RND transporter permease subunit [unclassified Achromobacter]OWT79919.1 multidrug transporter subunit MdtC [Achromobacter sp. HZ34]OWT81803.1 multidrug transporter subunit MdtC [Achromobacter sp. HZ28]